MILLQPYKKYAIFTGRARRGEYWGFILFVIVCTIALGIIDVAIGLVQEVGDLGISNLYSLFTLLPAIAVTARRLHDIGKSGWLQVIPYIPLSIGFIIEFFAGATGTEILGGVRFLVLLQVLGMIGGAILLVLMCLKGQDKENKYGPPVIEA